MEETPNLNPRDAPLFQLKTTELEQNPERRDTANFENYLALPETALKQQ